MLRKALLLISLSLVGILAFACGGSTPTSAPISEQSLEPSPSPTPTQPSRPGSTPTAVVKLTPVPGSTPTAIPNGTEIPVLDLQLVDLAGEEAVLSEDIIVEVTVGSPGFPVVGFTSLDAVVSVNGKLAPVDETGMFVTFLTLFEGPNFADVVASDLFGNQRSVLIVVFYIPQEGEVPLHVLWPADEIDVAQRNISVIGSSSPDAVVSVGGRLVAVNTESSFLHNISLEEGPNLIEVTASDLLGNSKTIQRVVTWVR